MSDGPGVRGSPFFQAICMFVVFALAGVPVYRLTRPAAAATAAEGPASAGADDPSATDSGPATKAAPLEVEMVFAPAPTDFQLRNLDQTVLAGRGPQARFQTRWSAAVPAEGVDLVLQARWAASTARAAASDAPAAMPTAASGANPAAARVTVRFADGRQVEKTVWAAANGTLTEVFTVPGQVPATVAAP